MRVISGLAGDKLIRLVTDGMERHHGPIFWHVSVVGEGWWYSSLLVIWWLVLFITQFLADTVSLSCGNVKAKRRRGKARYA
jgi:hypothetical protein